LKKSFIVTARDPYTTGCVTSWTVLIRITYFNSRTPWKSVLLIYMASNGKYAYEFITQLSWDVLTLKAYWLRDAPPVQYRNNCTLCPHCIYVFCVYLRTNSELCQLQHKLIDFNNRDEKCLLRGTDWGFK